MLLIGHEKLFIIAVDVADVRILHLIIPSLQLCELVF